MSKPVAPDRSAVHEQHGAWLGRGNAVISAGRLLRTKMAMPARPIAPYRLEFRSAARRGGIHRVVRHRRLVTGPCAYGVDAGPQPRTSHPIGTTRPSRAPPDAVKRNHRGYQLRDQAPQYPKLKLIGACGGMLADAITTI